jgi:hypothetical protein
MYKLHKEVYYTETCFPIYRYFYATIKVEKRNVVQECDANEVEKCTTACYQKK